MLLTIAVVLLVLLLVGGWPSWGYHSAGYGPSGAAGVLLVLLVLWLLLGHGGRLHF